MEVLGTLLDRGWIPLRQMAILLGMNELRGIYARQKGRNAIPTIRIGGIERVHADDVIETLQAVTGDKRIGAQVVIDLYRAGLRRKQLKGDQDG